MKQKLRRYLYLTLILILTLTAMPASAFADTDSYGVDAEWYNFRNNPENNGITDSATPVTAEETALKWGVKYGTGWSAAPTPPLILNGKLYIGVGNQILELDRETGEELRRSDEMIGNVGYAMNPLTYADGKLFVQVGNGCIQAVDLKTLQCLWYTEKIGGQTLCPISYTNIDGTGYIYSGTWASETRAGSYFCVTTDDENLTDADGTKGGGKIKRLTWQFTPSKDDEEVTSTPRGFYWAGAYACENYVAVGSDDGDYEGSYTDGACFYTLDPKTGEIIDKIGGIAGDIRTTTVYDNGYLYFGTKGGVLYKVEVSVNGELSNPSSIDIKAALESDGTMMTAAPIVYGNKIYVGVSGSGGQFDADGGHCFCVIDNSTGLNNDSVMYTIAIPGYPQAAALASTAYVNEDFNGDNEPDGRVYLYFTYNAPPGGIYYCYDTAEQTKYNEDQSGLLFTPPTEMQQYCISTICTDNEGTLYYKNDSCYLMAVEKNPAYLNGITVTGTNQEAVSWDRNFASTVTDYTLKVPATMETANITLDMNEGMTATVNGVGYKEDGVQIPLQQGDTTVTVVVSKDGHSRTYTLNVSMLKAISTLDSMKVGTSNSFSSFVNLTPEFASAVTDYSADTSATSNSFWRVWLKATDENSTINVTGVENVNKINTSNGTPATDGHDRWNVYKVDRTKSAKVRIDVTSEDGQVTTSYNLTLLVPVKVTGIEMSQEAATIDVTETLDLDVTVKPSDATVQTVKWYSSNEEIATVDENGKVTPLKAGNVTITAISDDSSSITAKCEVTITAKAALEGIKVGTSNSFMSFLDITPEFSPNVTEYWVNTTDIGTFSRVWVKAADPDATVEVTYDDPNVLLAQLHLGNEYTDYYDRWHVDKNDYDQDATIFIDVTSQDGEKTTRYTLHLFVNIDATGVKINLPEGYDGEIDVTETLQLSAEVSPDNATVKTVTWKSSDESIATVDTNGKVTPMSSGKVTITAVADGDNSITAECQVTITDKAAEVDALIGGIGEVTLDSKAAIDEARTAYEALTADQKALVTKLANLEEAEAKYQELKDAADKEETDKAAAKAVDEKITAIGEVTLGSKAAIDEARTAYEALTADQKALVTKLANLEEAEAKYQELKDAADKEETDKAAAKAVDEKITAIGEVTLDSKAAIDEARTAYEALTGDQKALVTKLTDLEAAEEEYQELYLGKVKEEAVSEINSYKDMADYRQAQQEELTALIEAAEAAIGSAESEEAVNEAVISVKAEMDKVKTDDQLAEEEKLAADQAAAGAVDEKITAIGEVTLNSKAAIDEARTAYEALTEDQKALVTKLSDLEAAEKAYEELTNGNDDQIDDPGQPDDNDQSTNGTQNNATDPENDKKDDTSMPKTGDDFMLLAWIAVLAFASSGIVVFRRERHNK